MFNPTFSALHAAELAVASAICSRISQNAEQTGQHWPFVVVGFTSVLAHIVGKHHTSEQKVLSLPPELPVAPAIAASTLILGLMQYAQQCPSISVGVKPAGHLRLPHVIPEHGSGCVAFTLI